MIGSRHGMSPVRHGADTRSRTGRLRRRFATVAAVIAAGLALTGVAGTSPAMAHPPGGHASSGGGHADPVHAAGPGSGGGSPGAGSSADTAAANAGYTAANLPSWAIGPFTRSAQNPLLEPSGDGYEAAALYNPGVLYRDGQYKMLYRAQGTYGGPSEIGYASSPDGVRFTEDTADNPVINFGMAGDQDKCGLEDPRLFELGTTYYAFFTSVHPKADGGCLGSYDISESTSTDAIHWSTPRIVEPNTGSNKDASVVTDPNGTPVKIDGEYVMYFGQGGTGSHVAYSDDMVTWHKKGDTTPRTADPLDLHYPKGWQPYEVCVAVTDYRTVAGGPVNHDIVMFTAGTLMANSRWYYAISEMEFSRSEPTRMLHQLSDAVLTPTPDVPYEWNGQTPKTVWMNSIFFHDGQWMMYYGGGDTVTALATAGLRRPSTPQPANAAFQTGFEHGQPMPDWIDSVDTTTGGGGIANVTAYGSATSPESSVRQEENHDGGNALMYSGQATGAADDHAAMRLFDLSEKPVTLHRNTTLSYWVYPQGNGSDAPDVSGDNSTCVAVDLVFADGSALRQSGGAGTPAAQCGKLELDAWNQVRVDVGRLAAGRKVVRVDLDYDQPGGTGGYRGYVDDIALSDAPTHEATITSVAPAQAAPGQSVTITGTGFGARQGKGHLLLSDDGVNWGGAGDLGTLRVTHWSNTSVTFTMPKPSGPAVSTRSGPQNVWRLEPGTVASVAVVTGPASVSGSRPLGVAESADLSDYVDDIGVSPDSNGGCGAFDNGTDTYSADALATASPDPLVPGAHVSIDGMRFTWPSARSCANDNVRALGQTILLPPKTGAGKIGFLGAATNGNKSGTVTIHYTDGSTGTATLAQTDWGNTPGSGNLAVAETGHRNAALGPDAHTFFVDEQHITVDPAKVVASITLPDQKDIHIFAIAEDGTRQGG
jgi:predicted GH43/DUF377 family glycosyl hydrolase